jgi:hypothetical protein
MAQTLFQAKGICNCQRCGAKCKVEPLPGSKAKMLKRSEQPKGLCINCAVHDVLRNLYPANLLLARSGPKGLELPHVQRQFEAILKCTGTDAEPGEINWQMVITNWDLPFPHKIKRTSVNPMNEDDLARQVEYDKKRMERLREEIADRRTPEQKEKDHEKAVHDYFKAKIIPLLRDEDR